MRTIVLVHGAWHGAWCWAKQQAELSRRGLTSLALDLPGHGASTLPLGDLYGDAEHTAAVLARVPGEVVLVGHSYGGAVITEAAALAGNVAHLVYLTAFCMDEGATVLDTARSSPTRADLGAAQRIGDDGNATLDLTLAVGPLYGDATPTRWPPPSPVCAPSRWPRSPSRSARPAGRRRRPPTWPAPTTRPSPSSSSGSWRLAAARWSTYRRATRRSCPCRAWWPTSSNPWLEGEGSSMRSSTMKVRIGSASAWAPAPR